jgi:phosphoglycolate phosphatase
MPPPFAAILFDLDGTLIDSARDVTVAVNRVLAQHGLAPIDDATGRSLMGEGARVRLRKAFALGGVALDEVRLSAMVEDFVRLYAERPVEHTRAYAGAAETLQGLAESGTRIGVCTNKHEASARDILQRLGLMRFVDDVAGLDTFGARKPDPAHLLKLLDRMRQPPTEAAMVGDSVHDIHAAVAAGLPCIAVSWGYTATPAHALGADAVIDHFAELPAALARLAG